MEIQKVVLKMEYFKQKLLLVEDDLKLSVSLISYYQQQGYVVDHVVSGKAAVDDINPP